MATKCTLGTIKDFDYLINNLSPDCVQEFMRGGLHPEQILYDACARSEALFTMHDEQKIMGMFGFAVMTWEQVKLLEIQAAEREMVAMIWAASTTHAADRMISAARNSRKMIRIAMNMYDILYTVADPEYKKTVRWLEWLGFQKEGERAFGPLDYVYHEMIRRK